MADSNLNTPVIVQATRLDTSILPRNIFSQSYLLYVIAQGTDVGNVANKANEAGQGAYDAQVRNDEQDVILVDHEERIRQLRIDVDDHEIRITANTNAIASLDVRLTTAEGNISALQDDYVSKTATATQSLASPQRNNILFSRRDQGYRCSSDRMDSGNRNGTPRRIQR